MARAAPRPCTHPGCGRLVRDGSGRCDLHPREVWSGKRRGKTTERGYGWDWQKQRKRVLERDGWLCQVCGAMGWVEPATEVDHILPKALGGTDDEANLQAICKQCHAQKTAFEDASPNAAALPEWLPSPLIPVTVVCGPPASGKSTWVAERAGKFDLVLDLDAIVARQTGKEIYHASREEVWSGMRVRNSLLAALARPGMRWRQAWLIVTAGTPDAREFWRRKYGSLVVMPFNVAECLRRIDADARRPAHAREAAAEAVKAWR